MEMSAKPNFTIFSRLSLSLIHIYVDQENDYKITHLADSFEEFIRGLEHESLYDPDEDVAMSAEQGIIASEDVYKRQVPYLILIVQFQYVV